MVQQNTPRRQLSSFYSNFGISCIKTASKIAEREKKFFIENPCLCTCKLTCSLRNGNLATRLFDAISQSRIEGFCTWVQRTVARTRTIYLLSSSASFPSLKLLSVSALNLGTGNGSGHFSTYAVYIHTRYSNHKSILDLLTLWKMFGEAVLLVLATL